AVKWPDLLKDFWFACGAGHGTIAALLQDRPGAVRAPVPYHVVINGRTTTSPSHGCGGMMRVAPIGFLNETPEKIFETGCESAAITHGTPPAYVASGIVALYTHFASRDMDMPEILKNTRDVLEKFSGDAAYGPGIGPCLAMMAHAEARAAAKPHD